jgi:hypothetical protein
MECSKGESTRDSLYCENCSKVDGCCCLAIHIVKENECCWNDNRVGNCDRHRLDRDPSIIDIGKRKSLSHCQEEGNGLGLCTFFSHAKSLYAAALGIEILCIAAAEIGENTGLYLFGFNSWGITIAYMMGYALASFTTFTTILGRYSNQGKSSTSTRKTDSCCPILEPDTTQAPVKTMTTKTTVIISDTFREI